LGRLRGGGDGGMSREQRQRHEQRENEKLSTRVEKEEKGNASFSDPAYIRWLTDEYSRTRPAAPYIRRFSVKTNEYNLNIFLDKFKNPDE
jgi:hypothetical protein